MNHKSFLLTVLIVATLVLGSSNAVAQEGDPGRSPEPNAAVGPGFTYQGRLTDGGIPATGAYDFRFRLYNAATAGLQVGATLSKGDIQVNDGYFNVVLNFGATAFNGQARWLEVGVRPGYSTGAYTVLSPRQALTATPYALYSSKGPFWSRTGNAGTVEGTNFLGTSDNVPLEIRVNNQQVLKIYQNNLDVSAMNGSLFQSSTPDYGDGLLVYNGGTGDGIHVYTNSTMGYYNGALYAFNGGTDPGVVAYSNGTFAGVFWKPIYVNGGCVGCSLVQVGMNAGEEPLEAGDLVAIRGLVEPLKGTDVPIMLVQKAGTSETNTVIGVVQGKAAIVESVQDEKVGEGVEKADGPASAGEYLFIVVQGITNAKVDASSGPIAVGQRLAAASNPGYARLLQTTTVNDVTVAEGVPVIGIALAPLDSSTGLIPVMVTLR